MTSPITDDFDKIDNPLEELKKIDEGPSFRIQNTMLHLTYGGHLDFDEWIKYVTTPKKDHGLGFPISEYSMVHETGDTGHLHSHILVKFERAIQSKNSRIFDFKGIHPNIKKVTTGTHWARTVKYHEKDGTPKTLLRETNPIRAVWEHDTVSDALVHMCRTTREVGGIIAAFNYKPIDYGKPPDMKWRPWQEELIAELDKAPDDRTINWIWDPHGCSGKTILAKHMGMYKGAFVSTTANIYHVATQLQEALKVRHSFLTVIFNFTRQVEEHKVYQALESLKDGLVTSQKYKGSTMYFPSPHVVVFANYIPDIREATIDRWFIRTISNGTDFFHRFKGKQMQDWIDEWLRANPQSEYKNALDAFKLMIKEQIPSPH